MTATGLLQVALHVDDFERARAFYTRLLGSEPTGYFNPPGLLFFQLGQTRLLLDAGDASSLVYLTVPDVRSLVLELRSEGVEIVDEPHVIFRHEDDTLGPAGHDEWQAFIRDSEGNLVGLASLLPAASA